MINSINEYEEILSSHPDLISNENALIKIIDGEREIQDWMNKYKAELRADGKPEDWGNIGVVLNDPYIVVLRDLVEFPGGRKGGYFRVINQADLRGGQGAVVFAEMNDKFLLLHQFRHPTRSWSYEIPRGFGEPGVKAEEQAINEIHEEVDGEIGELIDLGIYLSNTGLEGNKVKLFYAKLKSIGKPAIEEGIESILWVSMAELEEMIASAEITDGFTIAAYTRAKLRGLLV
ncbi:MAG TPA: NUDIX hydrolase [Anaerolineaceae bacterium]|nr:NUDIX hydrolase [Anaerolineaceae bacterium]